MRAIKAFKSIESNFKQPEVETFKAIQTDKLEPMKSEILQKSNGSTITTTTPKTSQDKPNVRLDRLGRISITILEIIRNNSAVTNRDLCNKLNKDNNYVKQYLYNLQKYGYICRNSNNWKWYLSELDNDFFVDFDNILYNIYNGKTKVKEKENNGKTKSKVLPLNKNNNIKTENEKPTQEAQKTLKTKQLNLTDLLQKAQQNQIGDVVVELSPIENKILMNLASWYDKTQAEATARPYKRYESDYAFAEEVGHSIQEVKIALAKLDDHGYIYTLPPKQDKYGMWKIGFTGDFLENVRNR